MTRASAPARAHLLIHDADGRTRRVSFSRDLMIGASGSAGAAREPDLAIAGEGISARHAVLSIEQEVFWVTALPGTGGTRVNGRPVRRKQLAAGDVITIGDSAVRIEFLIEPTQAGGAEESPTEAHRRTRLLLDLLAGLHTSLAVRDICATAAGIVIRITGAEWAGLALEDPPGRLRIAGAADTSGRLPETPTRIAMQVMAAGRSCFQPWRLCVPVECRDGRLGVLDLGPRPDARYTAHDLELVEALATHVGVALRNARRLEGLPGYRVAAATQQG